MRRFLLTHFKSTQAATHTHTLIHSCTFSFKTPFKFLQATSKKKSICWKRDDETLLDNKSLLPGGERLQKMENTVTADASGASCNYNLMSFFLYSHKEKSPWGRACLHCVVIVLFHVVPDTYLYIGFSPVSLPLSPPAVIRTSANYQLLHQLQWLHLLTSVCI